MSIGKKIKFFRKRRGMTQRELGTEVGFPPTSADVRIAQYESGSRTPKEQLRSAIAAALHVAPAALTVPDVEDDATLMHTLFAIEERCSITFSDHGFCVNVHVKAGKITPLCVMMLAWQKQRAMLTAGEISREEYDEWRYNFS